MRRSRWDDWIPPEPHPYKATPIFGCQPFGADTTCGHVHPGLTNPETGRRDGKMPEGTSCICMVCHLGGREDDPRLEVTAVDEHVLKTWKPTNRLGQVIRDQWSGPEPDPDAAVPTTYRGTPNSVPGATSRPRMKQYERRSRPATAPARETPMDPREIRREVDADRARQIA